MMVRTDVEEMTCEFQILRSRFAGLEDLLNELAEKNDKFSDWSRLED